MTEAESFLARMARASRERVHAARARESEAQLLARAQATPRPPPLRLHEAFDVIAELKLRSPAAGTLAAGSFDRQRQIQAYAQAGAAAISVLTEPTEFEGDLAHLFEASAALRPAHCPVMRKDFLTDAYQVLEARAAGAAGVLIIVTMLSDEGVRELVDCAREHGLFVLLEAFDREDLERIAALAPDRSGVLAGVNSRDLRDLSVSFDRFEALAAHLPRHLPAVAESGITSAADARRVAGLGYQLALVGSALMQTPAPQTALAELIEAGRTTRRSQRHA